MAKVTFQGLNKYISEVQTLRDKSVPACKKSLYAMADVFADSIRAQVNLHRDTGDLANSLYIHEMQEANGNVTTYIAFAGYDRNGTPNPLKANVLESGTADGRIEKTHFFTNAVKAAKSAAEAAAVAAFDEYTQNIVDKGEN